MTLCNRSKNKDKMQSLTPSDWPVGRGPWVARITIARLDKPGG